MTPTPNDLSALYSIIQICITLIPVFVIFYKISGFAHRLNENIKDIEGIGKKLSEHIKEEMTTTASLQEVALELKHLQKEVAELKDEIKNR